jgi:hypothetical protein
MHVICILILFIKCPVRVPARRSAPSSGRTMASSPSSTSSFPLSLCYGRNTRRWNIDFPPSRYLVGSFAFVKIFPCPQNFLCVRSVFSQEAIAMALLSTQRCSASTHSTRQIASRLTNTCLKEISIWHIYSIATLVFPSLLLLDALPRINYEASGRSFGSYLSARVLHMARKFSNRFSTVTGVGMPSRC